MMWLINWMSLPSILFRYGVIDTEQELQACKKYFNTYRIRTDIPSGALVIGRYSVLPFYRELEMDLANREATLINSYAQHRWIADFEWYEYVKRFTPESWFERDIYKVDYDGPFILKGATNGRKYQWKTHMYAENKKSALDVASRLANDPIIGQQEIIYRKYIPLRQIDKCEISGLPFVNEWRIFYYKNILLSYGFYWTGAQNQDKAYINDKAFVLSQSVANICANHVNFFVLDVAETATGEWILVEINDGQMSGLSENNSDALYKNLKRILNDCSDNRT